MKIGLISDIHAQLGALQKAFKLLQQYAVDHILCAGNLVGKGPEEDAVVRFIQKHRIPCVRGNHDEAAPGHQQWVRKNVFPDAVQRLLKPLIKNTNTYKAPLLTEQSLLFLQNLPFSRCIDLQDYTIYMTHGTPASNTHYVRPNDPPARFEWVAAAAESDIVLLGHTHTPMYRVMGTTRILNPGSVCHGAVAGSGTCAVLSLPEWQYTVLSVVTGQPVAL